MSHPTTSNKAICRTCGVSGPPWHHQPSVLDPEGIGDPGHKVAPQDTSNISNAQLNVPAEIDNILDKFIPAIQDGEIWIRDTKAALLSLIEQLGKEIIGDDEKDSRWDGQWRNGYAARGTEAKVRLATLLEGEKE